jgi:hypothetical protein
MAKYATTILAAVLVAALAACSSDPDEPDPTPTNPPVVYAAGANSGGLPTVWKDGVALKTFDSPGGTFYSIWVSGTAAAPTVYAVGESGGGRPFYWRSPDADAYYIAAQNVQGALTAVCIEGGQVYVAGDEAGVGRVWSGPAGGTQLQRLHALPDGAMPWAIAVSGTTVYTAGDDDEGACVWRNGDAQPIDWLDTEPGDVAPACFWAVGVSGGQVYAAGECGGSPVWLRADGNGNENFLGVGDGAASSLHVAGGSLHVAGWDATGGKVWRGAPGGALTQVVSVAGSEFESVRALGNDIYTGGWSGSGGAVWKNGTTMPHSYGAGSDVLSVFVVQ